MKNKKEFRKITIIAVSFFLNATFSISIKSQALIEGGPFLGISWYNGDLNPERLFYNIHPAFGGLVRYSINDRLGFKGSYTLGKISGEYPIKKVIIREEENLRYEFSRMVHDVAIMFEVNFFSFDHPHKKSTSFSPYLAFGAGTIFYKRFEENKEIPHFVLSLPFGIGVKWKLKKGLRVGAEWSMRKSFADDLDYTGYNNPVNPSDPYGFNQWKAAHNNDWVSFVGAYVSVVMWNRRHKCRGLDY